MTTLCVGILLAVSPALRKTVGLGRDSGGYAVGMPLTVVPAQFRSARRNVIVFSRSDCDACQRSAPILSELVADARRTMTTSVVLVVPGEIGADDAAFARVVGLPDSQVVGLDLHGTPLRFVPALAIVDQDGRILLFHQGVLTQESKREVVRMLS